MTSHDALKLAIQHIEHMAAFIGEQKTGYSFESLGEDMPGIREALAQSEGESRKAIEREHADLIARYYRRQIGISMQQAEHWAANGAPLAVHHRLMGSDSDYQIVVLFEHMTDPRRRNPFEQMRDELARSTVYPEGKYPPSADLNRYRDPTFVAGLLAEKT